MNGVTEKTRLAVAEEQSVVAWSDEQLMVEYRDRSDRRAFEELVRRYEGELFGYLRHYLGDSEKADDVFQQTFFQVHLKCGKYETGRQVRPWLYAIATNQAIDYQRTNRRHRMVSLDRRFLPESDDGGDCLASWMQCDSPGPAEEVEAAEFREGVRRVIDGLSDLTKQVVNLVYFQGLKYREAAEVLSVPVGTVKSRLHAAVAKLEGILTVSQS